MTEELAQWIVKAIETIKSGVADKLEKAAKLHFLETEPYINEIVKAMQLYPFPNADIEKIIDETTNQVVKI